MDEFDIKLKLALEAAFREEWQELEEETAKASYEFPEGFDEMVLSKAYKVLNTKEKSHSLVNKSINALDFHGRPRIRRALLVAALIAVMLLGTITAYALTHPEIIYNIKKSVAEWTFHFQQNDPENITEEFVPMKPETPEGFEITSEEQYIGILQLSYENGKGNTIFFHQNEVSNLGLSISGEGDEYKNIEINGYKGVAYHDTNDWSIIWDNGLYLFKVNGNVDYEILFNMAESIE